MESLVSFIFIVFGVGLLFCCITFMLNVLCMVISMLYLVIKFFFELFSRPKYPNCTKAIRRKAIRCPHCRSALGEKQPQEEINPELYTRVKSLVAEQTWGSEELTPDTHLSDDLGIVGDAGYDLLEAFCEEFEIQKTCEIDPYEYFGPEGWNPFYIYVLLYDLVFDREKLSDFGQTSLTMRDLVKSAEAKRWLPPEATS